MKINCVKYKYKEQNNRNMKSIISEVNSEEEKKIKQMYVNVYSIYNEIMK